MTDYEEQNQTEYTDAPQRQGQNPDQGQNPSQPQNGYGPQGQDPYGNGQYNGPYCGPQNGGSYNGPQNGGPYYGPQNGGSYNAPQNGGQYNGPQNGGPYYGPQGGGQYYGPQGGYDPYGNRPPKKPKNGFATAALICGLFSLLSLCCFAFPLSIILGVGAISFAVISKKGQPFYGAAIAGIILGAIAVVLGVLEFVYIMAVSNLLKDPANAAIVNQFMQQLEQQMSQMQ